jgi:predicted DsbA family dithiol-disulfide isomerase
LLDIAASVGLHREAAKAALDDEELEARVLAEERQAWDMNISGVPAMVVNGKFMIPGAQSPDTYVTALRRVAEKSAA